MQWAEAVEAHRRDTRDAILDATGVLVAEIGLPALTMPKIAAKAGIAPARLHRHFADLDAVLHAWHQRQVANHLAFLGEVGAQPGSVTQRLDAVLRSYAAVVHQTHDHRATERGAALHSDEHLGHARRHLHDLIRTLIAEGAASGELRADIPADTLAERCVRALAASGGHTSANAVRQLVADTVRELAP